MSIDPVNEMSVKEYTAMKIQEKRDQINGARNQILKIFDQIYELEKEFLILCLEQKNGYQFQTSRNCVHCKGTLYPSGDECKC
jgi:hypothetical protein